MQLDELSTENKKLQSDISKVILCYVVKVESYSTYACICKKLSEAKHSDGCG